MNDFMHMMVKMRGEDLTREARQRRRVAEARRGARAGRAAATTLGRVTRRAHWLAMAAGQLPTTTTTGR
ncbi:MAG TPA: hypothetical protein VMG38_14190 [Trebonia sp.]|nr:hypothetical protein [Trebonia sp.]